MFESRSAGARRKLSLELHDPPQNHLGSAFQGGFYSHVQKDLRQVLGDHVVQKGSLVAPDRLRFDFSHPKPVSDDEIRTIEDLANEVVLQNDEVTTRLMEVEEAIEAGAMALFGEKYGEEVRVVGMGRPPFEPGSNRIWSLELCGGTHVARTGDIGTVWIEAEGGVAAGVRRIEALTGHRARRQLAESNRKFRNVGAMIRVPPAIIEVRLSEILEEKKRTERELTEAKKKLALSGGGAVEPAMRRIGALNLMARAVEGVAPKDLRGLVDQGKRQVGSGVVAIVGIVDGKAGLVVGVTDDLTGRINAVDLARLGSEALGGKGGGGRPDMAQAGGPDGAKADAALEAVASAIGGN